MASLANVEHAEEFDIERLAANGVSLRPSTHDERPFLLRVEGRLEAGALLTIGELGYEVVGVSHLGDHTNVHVDRGIE